MLIEDAHSVVYALSMKLHRFVPAFLISGFFAIACKAGPPSTSKGNHSAAEPAPYTADNISWRFNVMYPFPATSVVVDSDPTRTDQTPMPPESGWVCFRSPAKVNDNIVEAGWDCKNDKALVLIRAACYIDKEDQSNGKVALATLNVPGIMGLSVWCESTTPKQEAPKHSSLGI